MQAIQQIYNDCPENIPVPKELRHCKVKIIILPLEENTIHPAWTKNYIDNLGTWEGDLQRPEQPVCEEREFL